MTRRGARRRGQRGQAMIETAVVLAVILALLMGVYSVSTYASDQNTAGTATRAGARLAAELGNGGYVTGAGYSGCQLNNIDPCAVDLQVVQDVCQVAATMPFIQSIDEVDIYHPVAGGNGSNGDLYDRYTGTSCANLVAGAPQYTLNLRIQTHPNEASVGVSLHYHYKSPTPLVPLATAPTVYTVVLESPRFT